MAQFLFFLRSNISLYDMTSLVYPRKKRGIDSTNQNTMKNSYGLFNKLKITGWNLPWWLESTSLVRNPHKNSCNLKNKPRKHITCIYTDIHTYSVYTHIGVDMYTRGLDSACSHQETQVTVSGGQIPITVLVTSPI